MRKYLPHTITKILQSSANCALPLPVNDPSLFRNLTLKLELFITYNAKIITDVAVGCLPAICEFSLGSVTSNVIVPRSKHENSYCVCLQDTCLNFERNGQSQESLKSGLLPAEVFCFDDEFMI